MLVLGIILLVIGVALAFAPVPARNARAVDVIGWILIALGVLMIVIALVDAHCAGARCSLAAPFLLSERIRSRLAWWRHDVSRWLDMRCLAVARALPGRLRRWVVVDSTNEARRLYPHPTKYDGPDGLGYAEIYDGAQRARVA